MARTRRRCVRCLPGPGRSSNTYIGEQLTATLKFSWFPTPSTRLINPISIHERIEHLVRTVPDVTYIWYGDIQSDTIPAICICLCFHARRSAWQILKTWHIRDSVLPIQTVLYHCHNNFTSFYLNLKDICDLSFMVKLHSTLYVNATKKTRSFVI